MKFTGQCLICNEWIWGFGYTGQRVGPPAQAAGRLQAPSVRPTLPKHHGRPRTGGQAGWMAMLRPWETRAASLLFLHLSFTQPPSLLSLSQEGWQDLVFAEKIQMPMAMLNSYTLNDNCYLLCSFALATWGYLLALYILCFNVSFHSTAHVSMCSTFTRSCLSLWVIGLDLVVSGSVAMAWQWAGVKTHSRSDGIYDWRLAHLQFVL